MGADRPGLDIPDSLPRLAMLGLPSLDLPQEMQSASRSGFDERPHFMIRE
jgi:hypothetical protein